MTTDTYSRADEQHAWVMEGNPRATYGSAFTAAPT